MHVFDELIPDLQKLVTFYLGSVVYLERENTFFSTKSKFRKSKAVDCIFVNFAITSVDHQNAQDIPKTLRNCAGVPQIKTHTLADLFHVTKWTHGNIIFTYSSFFQGDISQWDVSNVTNMNHMFYGSKFNGDISQWDVSKVTDMSYMFASAGFNGDISQWNVSNVTNMDSMFFYSYFGGDISNWDISSVKNMDRTFYGSSVNPAIIEKWNINPACSRKNIFYPKYNQDYKFSQEKTIYSFYSPYVLEHK